MRGVDWGYGKIKGSVIRDAGYDFVIRYVSHSPGKNITAAEYTDLKSSDLSVGLVWETTTSRPLDGHNAGQEDATSASRQAKSITGEDRVIYFAVDADYDKAHLDKIADYFCGINDILLPNKVGVYGGYSTVKYMLDNKLATYAWQTYAWSHGKWDERAQLRQTNIYGPKLAGVACDTNESVNDDNGLF